ncbi:MAG TPA: CsbA family protein [Candidatus Salinicoccus merdavium]|nr:CsbA family protein [Candidatus Salinicoccus merdavium]
MDLYWLMMALVVPAVTVVVFARLTRNKYVAVILTFILYGVSIYRGFYNSEWVIYLDAISLVIGYVLVELYNIDQVEEE